MHVRAVRPTCPAVRAYSRLSVPRNRAARRIAAFEYVQKAPDFSLNDGSSKSIPNGVGYICLLERSQGDQVLVAIRSQGLRGWAPASALVPLNHAETFFSQQILANPRDPFAYLDAGDGPIRE